MSKVDHLVDQIRRRILTGLHVGELEVGDRLPSIRTLAGELGEDHRAIADMYRRLEEEGLVEIRARSGVYVASGMRLASGGVLPPTARWVTDIVLEGLKRRIPVPELAGLFEQCTLSRELTCLCIESVVDALDAVCREVEEDLGLIGSPLLVSAELTAQDREAVLKKLDDADIVVTTVFHGREIRALAGGSDGSDPAAPRAPSDLAEVEGPGTDAGTREDGGPAGGRRSERGGEGRAGHEGRTAAVADASTHRPSEPGDATPNPAPPVIEVRINSEWMATFRRALRSGPVTVVVRDPAFESRLRTSLRPDGAGLDEDGDRFRIRSVDAVQGALDELSRDGSLFLTPAARAHLDGEHVPPVLQNAPMLSPDTLRQLAEILVRRNVELDQCA